MTNYEKMIAEMTPEGDEPFWDENDTFSSVFRKAQELQAKHDRNVVRRYRDEELPPDTGRTVIKKIASEYFEEVRLGYKNFELRKMRTTSSPAIPLFSKNILSEDTLPLPAITLAGRWNAG